ncbi:MAG: carboxypeptidase regulatory-like domain-containing protein [Acidobacteria bacterium]|nr:carboxypeptidase regulatory-like domain-containing protein [Acidobacteriota bacterium]
MFANSYTGTPPNGPAQTQTIQLLADPAPGSPPSSVVNVTATISNQQYTGVGTGPGSPVVMFGGRRADGTTTINTTPIFDEMNSVGSPADLQFSSLSSGAASGIVVADNHAFAIYSSIQHWEGLSVPATNSRVYVADLTISFSAPVTNPYLHFVGMGGFVGLLGYATELDLTTPALTMTKLQGNNTLVLAGNQINNANATGILTDCNNETAGCGTIRVNGTNISTIAFQVFIRGDGGTATWSGPNRNEGDFWMMGVSLASAPTAADVTLAGRVTSANGRGIGKARLTLTDEAGQRFSATTNPFGYYRFEGIEAGQAVVVGISSKRHIFSDPVRIISLGDNAFDVNFVADN